MKVSFLKGTRGFSVRLIFALSHKKVNRILSANALRYVDGVFEITRTFFCVRYGPVSPAVSNAGTAMSTAETVPFNVILLDRQQRHSLSQFSLSSSISQVLWSPLMHQLSFKYVIKGCNS